MPDMSIRENFEKREKSFMAAFGCLSSESRGRSKPEPLCPVRTEFQRDRNRIVFSNSFRRLKHKTQVFLSPLGDHYRTRLTHTLEVAEIARAISRALRLNEDLAEAIALGHDLGHTPFGHSGETALKEIYSIHFSHNEQSLRMVDVLENNGEGLNLTFEVKDGILKHSKGFGDIMPDDPSKIAITAEGRIVRIADIMAYLNHDLDDAIRSGVINRNQVPKECKTILGHSHSERATTMIRDVIFSSKDRGDRLSIRISDTVLSAMYKLREFLYENVYRSEQVHREFLKAKKILIELYEYFLEHPEVLAKELAALEMSAINHSLSPPEQRVSDFIASLTDRHALALYKATFVPTPLV
jgi:dGTPase